MPATCERSSGTAAAHKPNAPSTWTHAPRACALATIAPIGSDAPVLTLPACAHTIVGPLPFDNAASSASVRMRP